MRLPGSDHPITIAPHQGHVVVRFGDSVVAETDKALELREAGYPMVLYIPRGDARLVHYEASAHTTRCPYKGEASYFTLVDGERRAQNAVWTYEAPYPAMKDIANYVAFYRDRVSISQ